jgi:hypothetical protein
MTWIPVYESSVVEAIKYKGGATYCYGDVSPEEYEGLLHAPSKGRYVNIVLRRTKTYTAVAKPEKPAQGDES